MKLKEWLIAHKDDEIKRVYYTCIEGAYKRDSFGKLYIGKKLVNKFINYKTNKMYLECDVVKTQKFEGEEIDPIYHHRRKTIDYCCWLDNDQVELIMKRKY